MAERIQKIRECDTGGCRRRKGVLAYVFKVRTPIADLPVDDADGNEIEDMEIELCPYHFNLNIKRLRNSGLNTKIYEEVS